MKCSHWRGRAPHLAKKEKLLLTYGPTRSMSTRLDRETHRGLHRRNRFLRVTLRIRAAHEEPVSVQRELGKIPTGLLDPIRVKPRI